MKYLLSSIAGLLIFSVGCSEGDTIDDGGETATPTNTETATVLPILITINDIALNPEGIEYDKNEGTFFLSSLNAAPIVKVALDGTYAPFTSGEAFPLSTAGLQIDYERNRLLAAGFNGTELFDDDPETKGTAYLRVYDLESGVIEQDINLSFLLPDAPMYFANDIAVDNNGNAYVSDWFAGVIYKVDMGGTPSVFWTNQSGIPGGPNGLDFHPDGYLLVSVINDGTYSEHVLVKVPLDDPSSATNVAISDSAFAGFDGMIMNSTGQVVGVTNNGTSPGGNVLIELSGSQDWSSASVSRSIGITTSTTVAVTSDDAYFVVNQDFSDASATSWTIEQIEFPAE